MVVGETSGKQSVRQIARRAVLDAQAKIRTERVERDKRLSALGVTVMITLGERDQQVTRYEERAGAALATMIQREGLTLNEAVAWCGLDLSTREAARLRRLSETENGCQEGKDSHSGTEVVTGAGPVEPGAGRGAATGAE